MSFQTFQDFTEAGGSPAFLMDALNEYKASLPYRIARDADEYDHRRNITITRFVRTIMSSKGVPVPDTTASNNRLVSAFFPRLNTQRNVYSLGNGVSFPDDKIKDKLGQDFDTRLQQAGYYALVHGVSYLFWNLDRVYVFPMTEFVPFWDEDTGALRAGLRFWRLAPEKPLYAVLYEEDGYTKLRAEDDEATLAVIEDKRPYKQRVVYSPAEGEAVVGGENYGSLPIVPLWGSRLRQSTLVGMRESIDSYDLIRSGFANDLTDCAEIYWILDNVGGMTDEELSKFRENLLFRHVATVDADTGVKVTPYTQEIPYQARSAYLDRVRAGIYEDFGGLDVHTIAAGATNDHIDAAYQPMDENADDYEYQVIECVGRLLALQGISGPEAVPQFKRNRISNQLEQVQMVVMEAPYLDDETILNKLPNISTDEVAAILEKKELQETAAYGVGDGEA
jgi:hypothetical protein